ncbi:MAG: hypothetical protein DHS20C15_30580 [Planctomycetota bacterium]|nr:MAG: hypothetical protein DHS20C15_30580 [Planctomycetota bacterium]
MISLAASAHRACLSALLVLLFTSQLEAQVADGARSPVLRAPLDTLEAFALADDRAAVLETLLPGTQEHSFYSALLAQHEGRLDDVPDLLDRWVERHGRSELSERIRLRQLVLSYERDPSANFAALREELNLRFDQLPDLPGQSPDLPTRLDPSLVSRERLVDLALERGLSGIPLLSQSALVDYLQGPLKDLELSAALAQLDHANVPGLPALLVRHLGGKSGREFGVFDVHALLLLDQLDECARLMPALLNSTRFVNAVLQRLAPADGVDLEHDDAEALAYFERLEAFMQRLPVVHNGLRARVLHARLVHDRAHGVFDRARFMAYLALPRAGSLRTRESYAGLRAGNGLVDGAQHYELRLPSLPDERALIRAYLEQLFQSEDSFEPYATILDRDWLRRVFAETKILHGLGDMQRWSAMLDDPEAWRALEERVEIGFAPEQVTHFAADDNVVLQLDLKNVPSLLVRVFEIDAFTVHSELEREVDASLDLDGLVPNHEFTHEFSDSPLRRVRRRFEFPVMQRAGVYLVDFVGNGHSSRAVIRKGRLTMLEQRSAGGHLLRVYDERGQPLRDASAWLDGRQFEADDDGNLLIPFSTKPGSRWVLLRHGDLSERVRLDHAAETYDLELGAHVSRESLIAGARAPLVLRPRFTVSGEVLPLSLLENVVIEIRAMGYDGVESALDLRDPELHDDAEFVHELEVPKDLAHLTVQMRATIRSLSAGSDVELESGRSRFELNAIRPTQAVRTPLLGRNEQGYVFDLLGRTGEPLADVPVRFEFTHRDVSKAATVTLKTNADGRIELGELPGIWQLRQRLTNGHDTWDLRFNERSLPQAITAARGDVLRVPALGLEQLSRRDVSLVELRQGVPLRDRFLNLSLSGGFLVLRELPAGSYRLELRAAAPARAPLGVDVSIVDGPLRDGHYFGANEILRREGRGALHLQRAHVQADALHVQLANHGADTRVHLFPTRYLPSYDAFGSLNATPRAAAEPVARAHGVAEFHTGVVLSDEQRYILDRRLARIFPGNMLRRPSLLLNPLALDQVDAQSQLGLAGSSARGTSARDGSFGRGGGGKLGRRAARSLGRDAGTYADLDFLPAPASPLLNLRTDEHGLLRVPLEQLGEASLVQIVVTDRRNSVSLMLPLAETPLRPVDRGLQRALAPEAHAQQRRRLEFLDAGELVELRHPDTTRFELIDSLASAFNFFRGLNNDARLDDFAFLLKWPEMSREERLAAYSEHACHELHLFLHEKDPEFFAQVVRPFLANKLQKTFLDHWLLDADLHAYLAPQAFARLNTAERVLLGQRVDAEQRGGIARHVADQVALAPLSPAQERALFEALLRGSALESNATQDALAGFLTGRGKRNRQANPSSMGLGEAPVVSDDAVAELGYNGHAEVDESKSFNLLPSQLRDRAELLRFYRDADPTRRFVEHNYWQLRMEQQHAGLIAPNAFWLDLANTPAGRPFRSTRLAEAAGSVAEMLFALALLDLPFVAQEHSLEASDEVLRLVTGGPALLVLEDVGEAVLPDGAAPILVSQEIVPSVARDRDKQLPASTEQLLRGEPYSMHVVVSNPSSQTRELELLVQLPSGAVPLENARATQSRSVRLGAYSTERLEVSFYVPRAGPSTLFPVHVSQDGELLAAATGRHFEVLAEAPELDTSSWVHVSQAGSLDDVLSFLTDANLFELDLSELAWRMRDRAAFEAVLELLRGRQVFAPSLWAFGLHHRDLRASQEFLSADTRLAARLGDTLASRLLPLDAVARQRTQHVEFDPLHNARAHQLGRRPQIELPALDAQYHELLEHFALQPALDDEDWLQVAYDLLLQDRIEEGLAAFERVGRDAIDSKLQYDFARAWLAVSTEDHALARELATAHADTPVPHWQARFRQVLAQLDEAAGAAASMVDPDDRDQSNTLLAAQSPNLELELEARQLTVRHTQLTSVEVNYYAMDVESLFSANPFVEQGASSFAVIRPNRSERVALDDSGVTRFELPAEYQRRHVLVELRAGGLVRRATSISNQLAVQYLEDFGQLQVRHAESNAPLSKVYVKVYARSADGSTRFHKDGYTDLRGRFDYVSLSATDFAEPTRFAILVLSDEHGATLRELDPPVR